ncbi:glycosyltransferase family 4 protein [Jatrophihabitans sp.]|uniref:glycosyltransferase family 4 protein n=1 Tax=Jatrophihabitans sp. TaxID=1932789 RepID=UPI002CD3E71B|nr:glycosyltransferase family 4 protein [Jatrophihabitans sp.]
MTTVHVVLPNDIDDPAEPSGGNCYDRQVCDGLAALGWTVVEHPVPGPWPQPDRAARARLAELLGGLPNGSVVLLDGLVGCTVPDVLLPHAERLRLVLLLHMPIGDPAERAVLPAAAAVVTTSGWTRRRVLERYRLDPATVHVAEPGVTAAGLAPGTATGAELLCVATVSAVKGHDLLVDALALLDELPVRCTCVGSLTRDPDFVAGLRHRIRDRGLDDRVCLAGPRTGADLDACYAAADVLVLASRSEPYGMVITEALARGLPVIAPDVGGVAEALGAGPDGSRPGLLVAPERPAALADALGSWLGDAGLRDRLRATARQRRGSLAGWAQTADRLAGVLTRVAA